MANYEGGTQRLSGAGAVDLENFTTEWTTTGTDAATLADGGLGQRKMVVMVVDGGIGTLTPTNAFGFTSIAFSDVGDSATLQYFRDGWALVAANGFAGGPVAS